MFQFNQDRKEFSGVRSLSVRANGFILLEVLLAMSLVATSWMALGNSFQHMILRLGQLQEKRVQMKKELDQHELTLFVRAQENNAMHHSKGFLSESIGVSRRSHAIPHSGRTAHQK
jgi:Tfp pilus assembly protein PilV